jgi:hypothetical protein
MDATGKLTDGGESFYASTAVFRGFASLMDPTLYAPLPDGWSIGTADIVDSTTAIAQQRYKEVNMAGAAVIAAVKNALGGRDFPFVFGGDGASFAVSPDDLDRAREALAATTAWVKDDLDLSMRAALVPIGAIREQGFDVRVARFAPSPNVTYAMFTGGGLGWAEAAMKRGDFAVPPAPRGSHPDLTGLSCRFAEIGSARGVILSVLVVPARDAEAGTFRDLIEQVIDLIERSPEAGRPVPAGGPPSRWPPKGLDLEARAARGGSLLLRRANLLVFTFLAYLIMRFRISLGGFVPEKYLREVVENSDFRKYDDGLRMILDCTVELADAIEQRLSAAAASGVARYGLCRQDAAMMTCFTPSALQSDHVHFIDGARGGYASAAMALKAMPA